MRPPGYSFQQTLHRFLESLTVELPDDISPVLDDHPLVRRVLPGAEEHELFAAVGDVDAAKNAIHSDSAIRQEWPDDHPRDRDNPNFPRLLADHQARRRIDPYVDLSEFVIQLLDL